MIIDGKRASDVATAAVLSYYRAFNQRDWDAMAAALAEDVEHDINQGTRERGRARFRAFLAEMATHYREELSEVRVMASDDGTHAAAEYLVRGEYLSTAPGLPPARGQRYVLRGGAFFTLEQGVITRITNYYNLSDWLKQIVD